MARLRRRRATVALGMSGGRDSLVADLAQEKAQSRADEARAEQTTRYNEQKAKQEKAETWAKEQNRLKDLSQQFADNNITLAELRDEVKKSKEKFPDNTDSIDTLERTAIRNRDTTQYNNYINGGMPFDELKAFAESRQKDGGDLSNLKVLMSQASANEDKMKYDSYKAGSMSYQDLQDYAKTRQGSGGDLTKLQGYLANAKTNEAKITDQTNGALYSSGGMSARDYTAYLNHRADESKDPKEAASIRGAVKTVENNETLKSADDIRAQYEAGQISGGEATARLLSVRSGTNDSATSTKVLNLVGAIQKLDAQKATAASKGSGSAQATVDHITQQTNLRATEAQKEYDKSMQDIRSESKSAGPRDFARLSDLAMNANQVLKSALQTASGQSPDPLWIDHYNKRVHNAEVVFSHNIALLASNVAENMANKEDKTRDPLNLGGRTTAAKFLISDASQNVLMSKADRNSLLQQGIESVNQAKYDWDHSKEGAMWADMVGNRANELKTLNKNHTTGIQVLLKDKYGMNPAQIAEWQATHNDADISRLVEDTLLTNPDLIRSALSQVDADKFATKMRYHGQGGVSEGISADDFSKEIEALAAPLRTLKDVITPLYTYDVTGLTLAAQYKANIYSPVDANGKPIDWHQQLVDDNIRESKKFRAIEKIDDDAQAGNVVRNKVHDVAPATLDGGSVWDHIVGPFQDEGYAFTKRTGLHASDALDKLKEAGKFILGGARLEVPLPGINIPGMPRIGEGEPGAADSVAVANSPDPSIPEDTSQDPLAMLQQIMSLRDSERSENAPTTSFTPPGMDDLAMPTIPEPPPLDEAVAYAPPPDEFVPPDNSYGGMV